MITSRRRCPPAPPLGFTLSLQTTQIRADPEPWVRLYWEGRQPLQFATSASGNRFDPLAKPWEQTQALYAGTSLETAIAEVLLRWHGQIIPGARVLLSESAQLRDRRVARFVPKRPLTVIDATSLGLARIEEAVSTVLALPANAGANGPPAVADDIFQCNSSEYDSTQAWGAWFRSQCPDADGIMWISRQFNVGQCLVLFEDRCGTELELAVPPVPLYVPGSAERATLERMISQLGWGIDK